MWVIIIALLLIGLILLIVEVIFIPGVTVVGVLGAVISIIGIVAGYNRFGDVVGFYILLSTISLTGIALFFSFRSNAWKKFSLNSTNDGKVNEGMTLTLTVGDTGITTSTLRPSGKADFNNTIVEVRTRGNYLEQQTAVKIVQIDAQQILVESINPL